MWASVPAKTMQKTFFRELIATCRSSCFLPRFDTSRGSICLWTRSSTPHTIPPQLSYSSRIVDSTRSPPPLNCKIHYLGTAVEPLTPSLLGRHLYPVPQHTLDNLMLPRHRQPSPQEAVPKDCRNKTSKDAHNTKQTRPWSIHVRKLTF